jgi:hypothetical protein
MKGLYFTGLLIKCIFKKYLKITSSFLPLGRFLSGIYSIESGKSDALFDNSGSSHLYLFGILF